MKNLSLFALLICLVQSLWAAPVSPEKALQAATRFYHRQAISSGQPATALSLVYASPARNPYFYVFGNSQGFVVVSGDDRATPILGYSFEGGFDARRLPEATAKWFESYRKEIAHLIRNDIPATESIRLSWQDQGIIPTGTQETQAVAPLLKTKWNQSPYYNALCPYDNTAGERTVSGCVATAMAQILKYWEFPTKGSGFHSYTHDKYGTLSANFANTTYQWSSMPNVVNSTNNAVATLMYHCGVSVDMNYGVADQGGSGAYVISSQSPVTHCSEYALKNYFGYPSTLKGIERADYTETTWKNTLKAELDKARPVLYAGFGSGGGHAFVCDGYDNNDFFHFNWGWGGQSDGYFKVGALNPGSLGTGGGDGGFNSFQQAVIGVEKPGGTPVSEVNLGLYSPIYVSASPLSYIDEFTVSFNLENLSTKNFAGDYTVAFFDEQDQFVGYVETKTGVSLQAGFIYTNNLEFTIPVNFIFTPGRYQIGAYARLSGGQWTPIKDNRGFRNFPTIEVVNAESPLQMYSDLSLSEPNQTIIQNKPFSLTYNIANFTSSPITAYTQAALYQTSDGQFVERIGITDNFTLNGNSYFSSPIKYNYKGITAEPGTYILAATYTTSNDPGNYILSGSSYKNPIRVIVKVPEAIKDTYEDNNEATQAYKVSLNFDSQGKASFKTQNSNFHVGTDEDYYLLDLPKGYDYTINGRLHDEWDAQDGITYTVDGLWSYSSDGITWSESFDDVAQKPIEIINGGKMYVKVATFFQGNLGTYSLDMKFSRTKTTGLDDLMTSDYIRLYPNPAQSSITLEIPGGETETASIAIFDAAGHQVESQIVRFDEGKATIATSQLAAGFYLVEIRSGQKRFSKKFVIAR